MRHAKPTVPKEPHPFDFLGMVAPCPPLETVGLADLFLGRPRSRRYPKFNIRRDIPWVGCGELSNVDEEAGAVGWNLRLSDVVV